MTADEAFEIALAEPLSADAVLLAPVAPDTPDQKVLGFDVREATVLETVVARDGVRRALRLTARAGARPRISYRFAPGGTDLPDAAYAGFGGRFETMSDELAQTALALAPDGPAAVRAPHLLQALADRFVYGHRETHLGTGAEALPALPEDGPATGSCVDIHSVSVAALRAMGVPAAYMIGGYVADGDPDRPTGHCWIRIQAPGVPADWDVSHHLEYGLGPIAPGLNPKPGRRFALSFGRAPLFDEADGAVEVLPALSGFHLAEGAERGRKLRTIGRFA